jgi:hypothetical protein
VTTIEFTQEDDRAGQDARRALDRLKDRNAMNWADWMKVGEALKVGREWAMRSSGSRESNGKPYAQAMSRWLDQYGLNDLNNSTRARLLKVMENRDKIVEWRAGLSDAERLRFNHPETVLSKWRACQPKSPGAEAKARARANPDKERNAVLEAENQELREERDQRGRADRDWLLGASVEAVAKEIVDVMSPEWVSELVSALGEAIEGGKSATESEAIERKMTEPPNAPVSRPGDVLLLGGEAECPSCGETTPVGLE